MTDYYQLGYDSGLELGKVTIFDDFETITTSLTTDSGSVMSNTEITEFVKGVLDAVEFNKIEKVQAVSGSTNQAIIQNIINLQKNYNGVLNFRVNHISTFDNFIGFKVDS